MNASSSFPLKLLVLTVVLWPASARAIDEITVYNAEIAKPGQWTLEQHLNYAINGRKEPDFPGGLVPNHTLNGTPELAYGVNEWYEIGFYAPFAVSNRQFLSDGFKIRHLFVSPNAEQRSFFYGINVEFSYSTPQFSETKFGIELRPIIGFRSGDYEFIINPIVDFGLGAAGEASFTPAARVARKINDSFSLGVEYYADLGAFGHFASPENQQHNIYGVVDFKVGKFDINFGVGYGLTAASNRVMTKAIIGTQF